MSGQRTAQPSPQTLPAYRSILLAVDSSDHSNRAVQEAAALAQQFGSQLTAAHVYAAKLHDMRFRQMEGGLPEQYREEQELERQREVHDSLITRGLSIITDSYLDQVDRLSEPYQVQVARLSLEGKNYRQLVNECRSGRYDLMVMGALGLGAVHESRLGTVCQRVSRRSPIDTLVIRQPNRSLRDGPIVVGIDGSQKAYGGLLTALALGQAWQVPVKVISAFDPYYHYVAFNRIAGVLSEDAGKVFRFQEQEQLHEEIIDSGLAKIYQGHLAVAQSIAADHGMEVESVLLDGKPHEVMRRYLIETNPALLVLGTTGIHADKDLDIGGNSEYLLNDAPCSVLLSQQEYQPPIDRLASVSTTWTREAEQRIQRVPEFVQPMAKMAILRYAQERGHTVITEQIVQEATAALMPNHAEQAMAEIVEAHEQGRLAAPDSSQAPIRWDEEATRLLLSIKDLALRGNISMRAEKRARSAGSQQVKAAHLEPFLGEPNRGTAADSENQAAHPASPIDQGASLHWQAAALARLMRVPEGFMRDSSKQRIERYAKERGAEEITLAHAEAGLAEARQAMTQQGGPSTDPAHTNSKAADEASHTPPENEPSPEARIIWHEAAKQQLLEVPEGFCRDMTRRAAEQIAEQQKRPSISAEFLQQVLDTFKAGAEAQQEHLPWDETARERIARAPDTIRGMLVREIEQWADRHQLPRVTEQAVEAVKQAWRERGVFHLIPDDHRSG